MFDSKVVSDRLLQRRRTFPGAGGLRRLRGRAGSASMRCSPNPEEWTRKSVINALSMGRSPATAASASTRTISGASSQCCDGGWLWPWRWRGRLPLWLDLAPSYLSSCLRPHRPRSAPVRRGQSSPHLSEAGRALWTCGTASRGTHFAVWAPNAQRVSVVGDFNHWDGRRQRHAARAAAPACGRRSFPSVGVGALYKFEIVGAHGQLLMKADPYGFQMQLRPDSASVVADIGGYQLERRRVACAAARRGIRCARRSRSMKCIRARGAAPGIASRRFSPGMSSPTS